MRQHSALGAIALIRWTRPLSLIVLLSGLVSCSFLTGPDGEVAVSVLVDSEVVQVVEYMDGSPSDTTEVPWFQIACLGDLPRSCSLHEGLPATVYNSGTESVWLRRPCGSEVQHRPDGSWRAFFEDRGCPAILVPPVEIRPGQTFVMGDEPYTGLSSRLLPNGEFRVLLGLQDSQGRLIPVELRASPPFTLSRPWKPAVESLHGEIDGA